jgi:RNA-directed DNA polymerase
MTLLARVASDTVIDAAYQWLCKRRRQYPPNSDVWWLRHQWARHKRCIQADLVAGRYRFAPLERIQRQDQDAIDLWSARDALVMKALTLVLSDHLPVSPRCTHVKGNGGSKYALRDVLRHLPQHRFVLRTDVKAYYASIDHVKALELLAGYIKDKAVLNLLWQTMHRTRTWGGLFRDYTQGISRGCALSPLLGAFFLHTLDQRMEKTGLFYVRFMDDILVLAPTRWKLRKAVALVNGELDALKLEKHPDKTFIGKIDKGFDFLGYHVSPNELSVAQPTWDRFIEKATRLYEQEKGKPEGFPELGLYVRRWTSWASAALDDDLHA